MMFTLNKPNILEIKITMQNVTQVKLMVYYLAALLLLAPIKYPTIAHATNSRPAAKQYVRIITFIMIKVASCAMTPS